MTGVMDRPKASRGPVYHLSPLVFAAVLYYIFLSLPVAVFFTPVPIYYAMAVRGRKYGLVTALGSALIIAIIGGPSHGLTFLALSGIMAVAAAECFRRKAGLGITILAAGLAPFIVSSMITASYMASSEEEIYQEIYASTGKGVDFYLEDMKAKGMDKQALMYLESNRDTLVWIIIAALPATGFSTLIIIALGFYIITRKMSRGHSWGAHDPGHDLRMWKSPSWLAFPLLAGMAAPALGAPGAAAAIGINILVVTMLAYGLHGLSIIHFWLDKTSLPEMLRSLILLALVFLIWPMTMMLAGVVGFFDTWLDIRGLKKNMDGAGPSAGAE